jgi:transcriptional repressor NrdR
LTVTPKPGSGVSGWARAFAHCGLFDPCLEAGSEVSGSGFRPAGFVHWAAGFSLLLDLPAVAPGRGLLTSLSLRKPIKIFEWGKPVMRCPYCHHADTKVLDSREVEDSDAIRRRRECIKCERRFTTYERADLEDLVVLKKDGRRERFDRNKLKGGIVKACEKRPVGISAINRMADDIERALRNQESHEVRSALIGELVMKNLKKVDKVAYIRFASVYRSFTDLESFQSELQRLLEKKR